MANLAYDRLAQLLSDALFTCKGLREVDPVGQHRAMESRLSQAKSYLDKLNPPKQDEERGEQGGQEVTPVTPSVPTNEEPIPDPLPNPEAAKPADAPAEGF